MVYLVPELIEFPQTEEEIMPYTKNILSDISNSKVVLDRPPDIFQFEPTNHCTLKCLGCPRTEMTREIGVMDRDTFSNMIKYIVNSKEKCDVVGISGFGEPTDHRGLFSMVDILTGNRIKTVLMTNGTNIDEVIKCVEYGLSAVCIDLTGTEAYKGISLEKIIEDVHRFLDFAYNKLKVRLQFIDVSHIIGKERYEEQVKQFIKTWEDFTDLYEDWIEIVVKGFDNFGGSVQGPSQPVKNVPCIIPWQSVSVLWDGSIVPCCRDFNGEHIFGNIKDLKTDPDSVWNSEKFIEFRKMHLTGNFPGGHMCKDCSSRGVWNGYFSPFIDLSKHLPECVDV